jgi:hypothetical protein
MTEILQTSPRKIIVSLLEEESHALNLGVILIMFR